eukprot:TRINITY_DN6083_c0_g1_i11.p1 TRINITY_DN6083_c0_g1~~TRINITY_DN6083_c0_g1_i11.p1  ORF type:complete len:213 (-),score=28.49 TRINITY_DN6083_c0_g1_i11:31-669(-)
MKIVTEFCDLGSVSDLINLRGKGFCAGSIAVVVFQTLLGLKYLHETDIIHRDLKAANLLVNRYGQVKIGDFGLAGKLNIIRQQGDIAGTLLWMAPEVLQRRDLDKSCDIWSLGITIIEMADCYPPFMELQTERQVKRQICNPQTKYMIKSFDAPILMKDFLYACLTYLPNGRPTCQNLLQLPFVKDCVTEKYKKGIVPTIFEDLLPCAMKQT